MDDIRPFTKEELEHLAWLEATAARITAEVYDGQLNKDYAMQYLAGMRDSDRNRNDGNAQRILGWAMADVRNGPAGPIEAFFRRLPWPDWSEQDVLVGVTLILVGAVVISLLLTLFGVRV